MTASLSITRRALPLVALTAAIAPARADTTDLALTCDTTLAPALRKVAAAYAAKTSVRVFVFPTGPGLIIPQLLRDIQNDIVVTQTTILDQAARSGLIAAPVRAQWSNALVIAGPQDSAITDRNIAAPDATPASDIDGPAVLARLDLKPARALGAVDTDEVAFLLRTGVAQAGLLHMTDVRAHDRLAVIRPVPPDIVPPLRYAASVTRLSYRPNPQGFVAFLASAEATTILTSAGLEAAT